MSDIKEGVGDNIDIFDLPAPKHLSNNKRFTTRYIRDDISVSISNPGLFYFDKKEIPAELLDIASNGALVKTSKSLPLKRKIILNLKFLTGKTFSIPCQCVYRLGKPNYQYGIQFDHYNNELGDYLLETQTKLLVK